MMGGSKEGTLLPLLLAGAGGGALLDGLGGHYGWFKGNRENANENGTVDNSPISANIEEAVAEAEQNGTLEAPENVVVVEPGGGEAQVTVKDMMPAYRSNVTGKPVAEVTKYLQGLRERELRGEIPEGIAKALGLEYLQSFKDTPEGLLVEGGQGMHATNIRDDRGGHASTVRSVWVPQEYLPSIPADFYHSAYKKEDHPEGATVYRTEDGRWKLPQSQGFTVWGRDVTWPEFQDILDNHPEFFAGNNPAGGAHSLVPAYNNLTNLVRSW